VNLSHHQLGGKFLKLYSLLGHRADHSPPAHHLSAMQANSEDLIEEETREEAEEEANPLLPKEKRLQLALAAFSEALKRWETYERSLQKGQKSEQTRPSAAFYASKFDVEQTTLRRRYRGVCKPNKEILQIRQRLTVVEEEILVKWILCMQSWGFPPLVNRVRLQAEELLKERGDHEPLGIHWIQKFLSRQKELKSYFAAPRDKERVNAISYSTVSGWFKLVAETVIRYQIKQSDIYNMDEKGFAMGQTGKQKVIALKQKMSTFMSQPGNREWVSLIECISGDGDLLPAFIIFKAKVQKKSWIDELEQGNTLAISKKGWTNNELAMEWFRRVFDVYTRKRQQGEYRMLIFDGHASHITNEAIRFCIDQKIILLCLPPHSTHILQPLDVGFFQPLATRYRSALVQEVKLDSCANIDKNDFIKLYQQARRETATPSTIASAWQKAGLFPFEPESILNTIPKPEDSNTRPFTPPEVIFRASDGAIHTQIMKTPANVAEFDALVHQAEQNDNKLETFTKLCKAFERQYIENQCTKSTNIELIQAQQRKSGKEKQSKEHLGKGIIMNHEILNERTNRRVQDQEKKEDKAKEKKKEARRRKIAQKAKKKGIELEKTYLQAIRYTHFLFDDEKASSPKKQTVNKTPFLDQTINLDFPTLALSSPSPSKDPVRRGVGKAADRQQKGQKSKQDVLLMTQESENIEFAAPVRFSSRGRAIRKPKGRD
jgi:hypothetical protein